MNKLISEVLLTIEDVRTTIIEETILRNTLFEF